MKITSARWHSQRYGESSMYLSKNNSAHHNHHHMAKRRTFINTENGNSQTHPEEGEASGKHVLATVLYPLLHVLAR